MDVNDQADTGNAELDDANGDLDTGNFESDEFATDGGEFDDEFDGEFDPDQDEADPDADEDDEPEADGDAPTDELIALDDGTQVPMSELRTGYMKSQDYTQKTTELAEERKAFVEQRDTLSERGQYVEQTFSNLIEHLAAYVPPEPELALAQSNPGEYQYQKALRENTIAELSQIVQMQNEFAGAKSGFAEGDLETLKTSEDAKLLKAMPHLKDGAKRTAFDTANKKTAMDFGFSEEEIDGAMDHRVLQLVHYARLGRTAEQNRANAKRRVQKPQKGGKTRGAVTPQRIAEARSARDRLTETGSIDDAVRALSA